MRKPTLIIACGGKWHHRTSLPFDYYQKYNVKPTLTYWFDDTEFDFDRFRIIDVPTFENIDTSKVVILEDSNKYIK